MCVNRVGEASVVHRTVDSVVAVRRGMCVSTG